MAKAIWDYDLIQADSEATTFHKLRTGSVALLLSSLQEMGKNWRWTQYGDENQIDIIEALVAQATEDLMRYEVDCASISLCLAGSGGEGTPPGGGTPSTPVSQEQREANLLPEYYVCDADHAFGMSRAIVEGIHAAMVEIFQKIELATNPIELASEVGDNVPGISLLTSFLDVMSWLQNTIPEVYDAAWSDVTRDEIACELRCKILDNCTLSFDDVFGVYANIDAATPGSDATMNEWFTWLYTLPLQAGVGTVKAGGLVALICMRFASLITRYFPLGIRSLELLIALSADESSSNWNLICDPCPNEWEHLFDWEATGLPEGWIATDGGVLGAGGWIATDLYFNPNDWRRVIGVNVTGLISTNFIYAEVIYSITGGNEQRIRVSLTAGDLVIDKTGVGVRLDEIANFDKNGERVGIFLEVDKKSTQAGLAGTGIVHSLLLRGTGTNPFV